MYKTTILKRINKKLMRVDLNEDINVIGRIKSKKPRANCKRDLPDSNKKIMNIATKIAIKPPFMIFFT